MVQCDVDQATELSPAQGSSEPCPAPRRRGLAVLVVGGLAIALVAGVVYRARQDSRSVLQTTSNDSFPPSPETAPAGSSGEGLPPATSLGSPTASTALPGVATTRPTPSPEPTRAGPDAVSPTTADKGVVTTLTPTTAAPLPPESATSVATTTSFEAAMWRLLSQSDDGTTLSLAVLPGGCGVFDHVEVVEDHDRVTLAAIVRRERAVSPGVLACPDALSIQVVTVKLAAPIGSRTLLGQCDPKGTTPEASQCRALGGV